MTPEVHKHYVWAVAVLILAAIIAAAYVKSHDSVVRAEQVKQDVQQQIANLRGDLRTQLESIRTQKESTQTPQQVVERIPQYVMLPSAPTVENRSPEKVGVPNQSPDVKISLPDAPSAKNGLYFPPEDVKPLFDKLADGKACDLKLAECQKELPLMEQRAKAAEKAMHGGGFFQKLKSNSKWFVIGGGIAAGALCGTGHCK